MLIAVLTVAASRVAIAEEPWRAEVHASLAGLPAVKIEYGYAGGYVPALNAPLALQALGTNVPFDGYIGFHFAVHGRNTVDVPVLARAHVPARGEWSFRTFAALQRWGDGDDSLPRELMIVWRDRDMNILATENAGTPPWTDFRHSLRPLRIVHGAEKPGAVTLGLPPIVMGDNSLPDRAQWYRGFLAVVTETATWLDLPKRVREAIFGSGVYVVLFDVPRAEQHFDELDAALLPLTFSAGAGSYDAPWPYRGTRKMPVKTRSSWKPKAGVDFVGPSNAPYIVVTDAAAWMADDAALSFPPPVIAHFHPGYADPFRPFHPTPLDYLRRYSEACITAAAFVICISAWVAMRRKPTNVVAVVLLVISAALLLQRNRIRPMQATKESIDRIEYAPDISADYREETIYGPTPIPARDDVSRYGLTGDSSDWSQAVEVRSPDAGPGAGTRYVPSDWQMVKRWTFRRIIGHAASKADPFARPLPGSPFRWTSSHVATPSNFRLHCFLTKTAEGVASCVFALPTSAAADGARVNVEVTGGRDNGVVTVTWAGGTIRLPPDTTRLQPDVTHQIVARGGIVILTVAAMRPLPYVWSTAWIDVAEEKKR